MGFAAIAKQIDQNYFIDISINVLEAVGIVYLAYVGPKGLRSERLAAIADFPHGSYFSALHFRSLSSSCNPDSRTIAGERI